MIKVILIRILYTLFFAVVTLLGWHNYVTPHLLLNPTYTRFLSSTWLWWTRYAPLWILTQASWPRSSSPWWGRALFPRTPRRGRRGDVQLYLDSIKRGWMRWWGCDLMWLASYDSRDAVHTVMCYIEVIWYEGLYSGDMMWCVILQWYYVGCSNSVIWYDLTDVMW